MNSIRKVFQVPWVKWEMFKFHFRIVIQLQDALEKARAQ